MSTDYLQETMESCRAASETDPRVVAAFVGGSLATGTADEYSDLDLYLITTDEQYDSFFAERVAFMCQLGEPVFLEDFNGFGFDLFPLPMQRRCRQSQFRRSDVEGIYSADFMVGRPAVGHYT